MGMLRRGSKGEEVEALQKKLAARGINPGPIDGIFGPKTDAAVRRFQEQEGLQVDGIVGPKTKAALGIEEPPTPEEIEAAEAVERKEHFERRGDQMA